MIKLSILSGRLWITWMGPTCNHTHTHETLREDNVKTEAEMGVVWPQAKEANEATELLVPLEDGRSKELIAPRASRGCQAVQTPT